MIERIFAAMERARQRALRSTAALSAAQIPYAVAGGNAVAEHVARVDPGATRTTPDVDIVVRREDLDRAIGVLEQAGFYSRQLGEEIVLVDEPDGSLRAAIHFLIAGERKRPDDVLAIPDVSESEAGESFRVLSLAPLVQLKLTANRTKDRMHVDDLIEVGLIDRSWLPRLPSALAERLEHLLDTFQPHFFDAPRP